MDAALAVEVAEVSDGIALSARMRHVPGADPETAPVGRLQAVSASTGKTLWTYQQRAPIYGSVLATAEGVSSSPAMSFAGSERSMPSTARSCGRPSSTGLSRVVR